MTPPGQRVETRQRAQIQLSYRVVYVAPVAIAARYCVYTVLMMVQRLVVLLGQRGLGTARDKGVSRRVHNRQESFSFGSTQPFETARCRYTVGKERGAMLTRMYEAREGGL